MEDLNVDHVRPLGAARAALYREPYRPAPRIDVVTPLLVAVSGAAAILFAVVLLWT